MRLSEYTALDKYISASDEVKSAIIQACDPFHDWTWTPNGLPDSYTGNSIVRVVKKTFQVENNVPGNVPFDCHIFTMPVSYGYVNGNDTTYNTAKISSTPDLVCSLSQSGNINIPSFGSATPIVYPIYPVTVVQSPIGYSTFPQDASFTTTNLVIEGLEFNEYMDGNTREIASAFEVHNVTNKLNVSGTVTVYRSPHSFQDHLPQFVHGTARHAPMHQCPAPPGRYTDALLLSGSRQWEAEYGVYIVETFDYDESRPQMLDSDSVFFTSSYSGTDSFQYGVVRAPRLDGSNNQIFARNKLCYKDLSGAYFTGLDPSTQLTITVTKVFETFPPVRDPLVTLARPSMSYHPEFFALYKEISAKLPPGVMVAENATGEWWKKLLNVVKEVAPTVGAAFGGPGAVIGKLVGTAAGGIQNALKDSDDKKAKKPKGQQIKNSGPQVSNPQQFANVKKGNTASKPPAPKQKAKAKRA